LFINKQIRINRKIKVDKVRVISPEGKQLGILTLNDALSTAHNLGLDLVEVSSQSKPPVCKIMNFGKYQYEQKKKQQVAKKKQTIIQVKTIQLRPKTEEHDYQFKLRNAQKFLEAGDKVKFSILFRGREITHPEIADRILARIIEDLKEISTIEQEPKLEGHAMAMILSPTKTK
jgi:translation initiation factor IF-3